MSTRQKEILGLSVALMIAIQLGRIAFPRPIVWIGPLHFLDALTLVLVVSTFWNVWPGPRWRQ